MQPFRLHSGNRESFIHFKEVTYDDNIGTLLWQECNFHFPGVRLEKKDIRTRTSGKMKQIKNKCNSEFSLSYGPSCHEVIFPYILDSSQNVYIHISPYEARYGKKCRSPLYWDEAGERRILWPNTVGEMIEIVRQIRQRIKEAQDRQRSYVDKRRTELHFDSGDKVFLKVSPSREIIRFGAKGKLRPHVIGPYEILEIIGPVAYKLALPPSFGNIHNVFHVSPIYENTFMIRNMSFVEMASPLIRIRVMKKDLIRF